MAEFVPGPWEQDACYPTDVYAGDLQICDCQFPQGELSEEAMQANARLVAAAPDLLAACEAFLALFRDSDMRPEDECRELCLRAKAAVAKARP